MHNKACRTTCQVRLKMQGVTLDRITLYIVEAWVANDFEYRREEAEKESGGFARKPFPSRSTLPKDEQHGASTPRSVQSTGKKMRAVSFKVDNYLSRTVDMKVRSLFLHNTTRT